MFYMGPLRTFFVVESLAGQFSKKLFMAFVVMVKRSSCTRIGLLSCFGVDGTFSTLSLFVFACSRVMGASGTFKRRNSRVANTRLIKSDVVSKPVSMRKLDIVSVKEKSLSQFVFVIEYRADWIRVVRIGWFYS